MTAARTALVIGGGIAGPVTALALRRAGIDATVHEAYASTADGVTARFADGSSATADVLIGADGLRSTVRTLIDPAAPGPEHVPLLNFAASADIAVPAEPDAAYFVFGRRAFLGYWLQPDGRTAWFANLPHAAPMTLAEARAVPAAYERLRRPRVERIAARAAKTNNSKALGPAAIAMMRLLMPVAMRTVLTPERTLGHEQRFRIDWEERLL
jgi:hypothetical protein